MSLTPFARALLLSAESEGITQIPHRHSDGGNGRCATGVLIEAVFGGLDLREFGLTHEDADWAYREFYRATGLRRTGKAWATLIRLNNSGKSFAEIARRLAPSVRKSGREQ